MFFFSCNMSASQKEEEPEEKNVTITGINVAALPNKVLYSTHEELVTSGLKINIVYSDGSTEECRNYTLFLENEERITNQSFSNCKAGPLTIYVKYIDVEYGTYTTQFSITIKKSAVNFYAAHELNKTEYTQQEKLDLSGLELRLDYNDDTSQIITEGYSIKIYSLNFEELYFSQEDLDNLNIPNHLDLGQYYIKFIYEEDNVVFASDFMSFNVIQDSEIPNIYIIAADISRQPDKTVFNIDEQISLTGIEFEYTTSDGQVYPYCGEYKVLYWDDSSQQYLELPSTLPEGDYLVYVKCEIELNGEVAWTIFSPISICVQDENNPQNPPEEIPPEEQFKGLQLWTYPSKTTYTEGEKLDLTGIEIYYYDGNYNTHPFTQEYTVKPYNIDTEEYFDLDAKLKAGSYSVEIIYNDGNTDWTTGFMITVVGVTDISEFSYKETEGGIVIGGFKGKEIKDSEEDTLYDYDAPYETVYSESSDFIYELIEGSETDVRIVSVNPDKCKIITDMTIPAHIDGYNVKEISCDAFIKTKGEYEEFSIYETAVRNLEIEEGVERFVYGSIWQSYYSYTSFFFYQFPYLKKLILPKGFSLYLSKELEDRAKDCTGIEGPNSSNYTFNLQCGGLEEIQLPSDLKKFDFDIISGRLKKLVIPASVEKMEKYGSGYILKLDNCEEIIFEGQTDIWANFYIPKVKELILTGEVELSLTNAPSLGRVIFTGNAKGCIKDSSYNKDFAPNKLEEIIIDEPENDEVYIGGGYKPYYTSYGDNTVTAGFKDLKSIKKLTLNLKEDAKVVIGEQAFKNCTALEEIAFTNHVVEVNKQAFMNCTALKSVKFAQSCNLEIGEAAFSGCTALERVSFPQLPYEGGIISGGVNSSFYGELNCIINTKAFYNVPAINEFAFKKDMSYLLKEGAFFGCDIKNLTFEENCEVFGDVEYDQITYFFDANSSIKEIDISAANKVYNLKFDNFTALQKFTVGNSSFIGGSLKNCTSLQTIDVGENAYFLPSSLQGCSSLQSVTLQGNSPYHYYSIHYENDYGLHEVGFNPASEILSDCDSLRSVTFKDLRTPPYVFGKDGRDTECDLIFDNLATIGDYSFYKCNFITSLNLNLFCPTEGPAYWLGDYCFAGCKNLKQVTTNCLGGDYIFKDCVNLEEVTLVHDYEKTTAYERAWAESHEDYDYGEPMSLTWSGPEVSSGTFYNCKNLKALKTDWEHTILGSEAFYNCENLEELKIPVKTDGKGVKFSIDTFYNCNKLFPLLQEYGYVDDFGDDLIYSFSTDYFYLDELTLTRNIYIQGINVKHVIIPRSLYYFIPEEFALGNPYIQTVTLDCDIEARAFKGCSALTTVILEDTTFHSVRSDSFADCPNLSKIIVPARFFEQYKTSSKWKLYRDLICTE